MTTLNNHANLTSNYHDCHGCSLCSLVCPTWQQCRDVRVTPHGHAKALQQGGEIQAAAIYSCILCGACIPICPQDIDIAIMLSELRRQAVKNGAVKNAVNEIKMLMRREQEHRHTAPVTTHTLFLAGASLRNDETANGNKRLVKIVELLNISASVLIAEDDGWDIALALEAGVDIPSQRLDHFLRLLRRAKKLIVSDGLLKKKLAEWLPRSNIVSIGYVLSSLPQVRAGLRDTDFYVIEGRAYHADYKTLLPYYDELQRSVRCELNLDLHRLAIPTGGVSNDSLRTAEGFSIDIQTEWLLAGRTFERIVVEDVADWAVLSRVCDKPVLHIAELAQ